ncbi:FAD-dependent oxidoreductase [Shewanella insulae]|uniref:glycerol-3-phosphate dehydrogenase/oxidase n=1 Tax=Shewanella insulae TaxID=2681496 RepID=UPI001EFC5B2D|nr:FAD-dependent oxidoreductase [Shewanella insulae]MCG9713975.1 FAD-dependent oxidoreductase [Shewanella insulae]
MQAVDLVVIGGGITGVGIAQCAQAAGYSVVLLEKDNLGEKTSSNSSKLIHGGLRYLESGQLGLVRQSLTERKALLTLAPELVKPVPFYIPLYRGSQRGPLAIRAGLSLYALLSELDPLGQFQSVPASRWSELAGLKLKGLRAVFRYWDAQTDDGALTRAVAQSARQLGAELLTQVSLEQIEHRPDSCIVSFNAGGEMRRLSSRCVINATGPWVNQTLERVIPKVEVSALELVQGSHLVLDIPAPRGIFYLESIFDKRVVFVMPWQGKTMIGTTETPIDAVDAAGVTPAEEAYLLGIYRHYFPLCEADGALEGRITGRYCGVRVLPKQGGEAFDLPRDTMMLSRDTHPNLLTVYGGKLTTFRHTAKEALAWVKSRCGPKPICADVDTLRLTPVADESMVSQSPSAKGDFSPQKG